MFPCEVETQSDAPWHLQRINQDVGLSGTGKKPKDNDYHYTYDSSAGAGVDIYILGIYIEHEDFWGRARWGPAFDGHKTDMIGHGTHVAGIAAGKRWGVAKAANLIAVKSWDDDKEYAPSSNMIAGLEWVFLEAKASGRPSVVNISSGHVGKMLSVNEAIRSATNAGIHVVVAAGNRDTEASGTCPANAPSALTVGASNVDDERWVSRYRKGSEWVYALGKGSNYGPAVDLFAPGDTIFSCNAKTKKGAVSKSGTSMASPIVAGIIARLISMNGNLPPSVMADYLKRQGVNGCRVGSGRVLIDQYA